MNAVHEFMIYAEVDTATARFLSTLPGSSNLSIKRYFSPPIPARFFASSAIHNKCETALLTEPRPGEGSGAIKFAHVLTLSLSAPLHLRVGLRRGSRGEFCQPPFGSRTNVQVAPAVHCGEHMAKCSIAETVALRHRTFAVLWPPAFLRFICGDGLRPRKRKDA